MTAPADVRTCYRHPDRVAGIVCQRCDRPICPACMHQASVGFHCPECTRQGAQKVYRGAAVFASRPLATQILIGINVAVYLVTLLTEDRVGWTNGGALLARGGYGGLLADGGQFGPLIADEPWRLVTSGFLHFSILHVGINMWVLWILGRFLEPTLGRSRFVAVYFASLLGGSLGAALIDPTSLSAGASGAIFGLMGAALVVARENKVDLMRSGLLPTVGLNLVFTFLIPGISIGGHVGGLVVGVLTGLVLVHGAKRIPTKAELTSTVAVWLIGMVAAGAAYLLMVSEYGHTF